MEEKMNTTTWKEYIDLYNSYDGAMTVTQFCLDNNISKGMFYYHKKKLENKESIVFQKIEIPSKVHVKDNKTSERLVKITIGKVIISIPINEKELISQTIAELVKTC